MARILIAEDNEELRNLLAEALVLQGHSVYKAEHGRVAILFWDQNSYDLLITDMQMPFAGGHEVIRTIRRNHPEAKVIALSADPHLLASLEQSALTTPQYSFTKPVSIMTLQAAIEELEQVAA
jgi:CheY-like chemotaxis protein